MTVFTPDDAALVVARLDRCNALVAQLAGALAPPIYRPDPQQAIVNASGFATLVFPHWPGGVNKLWQVERVFVFTNSLAEPELIVYVFEGAPVGLDLRNPNSMTTLLNPLHARDATNLRVAAGDQLAPIIVKGQENIAFQWPGLNQGALWTAGFQYRLAWQGES